MFGDLSFVLSEDQSVYVPIYMRVAVETAFNHD